MPPVTFYIDRSRVESRQDCARMRFWNYDYDGTGIARSTGALPLINGTTIHAAHARLLSSMDIEWVIQLARAEYRAEVEAKGVWGENDTEGLIREQTAMLEGLVRLWAMWRLPAILEEYELAVFGGQPAIEQAWEWQMAPGLVQRVRMDAILRRRGDGLLHILDYKTAAYIGGDWALKFEHTLQTELYVQALKERTREPVGGMLYEGLIKGLYRKDNAKDSPWFGQRIQASHFCYAYLHAEANQWSVEYTKKKGFAKARILDHMSTKDWVEKHLCQQITPADAFIVVPPICPPPFELESIKRQVVQQELEYHAQLTRYRELESEETKALFLDEFAPQNGQRCFKYGVDARCPFVTDLCWANGANPLEDGGYERRKPHHEGEELLAAA